MVIRSKKQDQVVHSIGNLSEKNISYDYVSISMGAFDFLVVLFWLLRKKCVRIWIGTDVYKCKFWDYRIRAKLLSLFCDNITVAPWLTNELKKYKINARTVMHDEHFSILSKWTPETSRS